VDVDLGITLLVVWDDELIRGEGVLLPVDGPLSRSDASLLALFVQSDQERRVTGKGQLSRSFLPSFDPSFSTSIQSRSFRPALLLKGSPSSKPKLPKKITKLTSLSLPSRSSPVNGLLSSSLNLAAELAPPLPLGLPLALTPRVPRGRPLGPPLALVEPPRALDPLGRPRGRPRTTGLLAERLGRNPTEESESSCEREERNVKGEESDIGTGSERRCRKAWMGLEEGRRGRAHVD